MNSFLVLSSIIAAVGGKTWHPVDQVWEGTPMCAIAQEFADGTMISVMVTARTYAGGKYVIVASNPAWSIKKGDALGEVLVSTPTGDLRSNAISQANAFAATSNISDLESFLGAAKAGGFRFEFEAKRLTIGPFASDGMDGSLPAFQSCIARRFDAGRDPFRK